MFVNNTKEENMTEYIGTKCVCARPMSKNEYARYDGRRNELVDVDEPGYLVEYEDGYVSWSPKGIFEDSYRSSGTMTFGDALVLLKRGFKVARKGWNGKGMFLFRSSAQIIKFEDLKGNAAKFLNFDVTGTTVACFNQRIDMKTADGSIAVGWTASQDDMLADDWMVLE